MGRNDALSQDMIALRRQRVSSLRARGLTHEEIYQEMAAPIKGDEPNPYYLVNPETREPFDRSTISRDLKWVRMQNLKEARQSEKQLRARQLAEIAEVKRDAWARGRLMIVLECLKREAALMGLDAPSQSKIEVDWMRELEAAGLNASRIEQQLVEEFKTHLISGAAKAD